MFKFKINIFVFAFCFICFLNPDITQKHTVFYDFVFRSKCMALYDYRIYANNSQMFTLYLLDKIFSLSIFRVGRRWEFRGRCFTVFTDS
jgi:hypothetical protein